MPITELYVDPSIAADTGTGTVGDPYGDLEYAIKQETFDTVNGTRINIKAGTDEIIADKLETAFADTSVSVAWAGSEIAAIIIQGYTTAAGDGGIGGISGGGLVGILPDATIDSCKLIDLHCHNTGNNSVINLDENCVVYNVEVDNFSGINNFGIAVDGGLCLKCYVHNFGGTAIKVDNGTCQQNVIWDEGVTCKAGFSGSPGHLVQGNIIRFDGTHDANGITFSSLNVGVIINNSIFAVAGTGAGILGSTGMGLTMVANNIIEGFSGVGGRGIDLATGTDTRVEWQGGNSVFNCTTEFIAADKVTYDAGGDEILTVSGFTDAANGDMSPVNTGSIKEGSIPQDYLE